MPRLNRTFSAEDVIRIYEELLTAEERAIVELFFARLDLGDPFADEREAFDEFIDSIQLSTTPLRTITTALEVIDEPLDIIQGALIRLDDAIRNLFGIDQ